MKKLSAVCGFVLALSACAEQPSPPPAQISHAPTPRIMLDVQAITLTDRSGMQMSNSPYNSNHFSPTIADAIKQWASDRLQAAGQSGNAIIVIKDAALTMQTLPVKDGMDSWFTRQQGVKYVGHAEVSIEANGSRGFAMADANATRTVTLPEDPTAIEKQDAYFSLLNGLMKDLGQNLEASIQTHMGSFLLSPPVYGSTAVPNGMSFEAPQASADDLSPVIIQSPQSAANASLSAIEQQPATPAAPVFGTEPAQPRTVPLASMAAPTPLPNLAAAPDSFGMNDQGGVEAQPLSQQIAEEPAPQQQAYNPPPAIAASAGNGGMVTIPLSGPALR